MCCLWGNEAAQTSPMHTGKILELQATECCQQHKNIKFYIEPNTLRVSRKVISILQRWSGPDLGVDEVGGCLRRQFCHFSGAALLRPQYSKIF